MFTHKGRFRTLLAVLAAFALLVAACGDDDDDAGSDDASASASEPAEETTTTEAAEEETTTTEEAMEEEEEEAMEEEGAAIDVDLGNPDPGEFSIVLSETPGAGTVTFTVANSGEFPHAFAIARGTSYEELPQVAENGAVDTEALGDDFLGTTDNIEPGAGPAEITFDLEAGDYVFFCPVAFGPNSHAAAGQVLSVTVG